MCIKRLKTKHAICLSPSTVGDNCCCLSADQASILRKHLRSIIKQLPFALCTIPETKIVNIPQIFCISKQLKADNNTRVLRVKSIYIPHNFTLILLNLMQHIANYALFSCGKPCTLTLNRAYIRAFPPRILDARYCYVRQCTNL
jgi:hypothetical protein